jgi:hypothetical protein
LSKKDKRIVFEKYGDSIKEKENEIEICINHGNYTNEMIINELSSDSELIQVLDWKYKLTELI